MAKGILIAVFDFTKAAADEFHDWYDLEHIPERERVPGFLACERWIGTDNPKLSVATYELEGLEVLRSAAYRAIAHENLSVWSKRVTAICDRLMRFEGEQILPGDALPPRGAGGLLLNTMNVAPEHEAEFNEWYDTEHIPALAAVPGTLSARRFRSHEADGRRYVALYHFASPEVPAGAQWRKAANTPWTERMRPHFRDHLRIPCRRYVRTR
jgi:heme-degrading monooxygenase HmoA